MGRLSRSSAAAGALRRTSERLAALEPPERRKPLLFGIALVLFVGAIVIAYGNLPELSVRWPWLGLTAALVLPTLLLNGLEYQTAGHILDHRIGLREAVRMAVLSSAANLLPLPGSLLVRTYALRRKGSAYGPAIKSNAAVGAGWVGVALILAGVLLLESGQAALGVGFMLPGLAALAAMAALLRDARNRTITALWILGIEGTFVLVAGLRLYGALYGIGIECSFSQAIALTVAGAVASAAGVFPGGLGLRELLAGALAPLIGVHAAGAVLAAAVDRLVGLVLLGLTAGGFVVVSRKAAKRRYGESSMEESESSRAAKI